MALVDRLVEKLREAELLAGQVQAELLMPGEEPLAADEGDDAN